MIFWYVEVVLLLNTEKEYFLQTAVKPYKRINIESNTVRATEKAILKKKTSKILEKLILQPVPGLKQSDDESTKVIIRFGDTCLGKHNKYNPAVIAKKCEYPFDEWQIEEKDDYYEIREGENCLTYPIFDKKLEGYYIHTWKCDGKDYQKWTFREVDEDKKEDKKSKKPKKKGKKKDKKKAKKKSKKKGKKKSKIFSDSSSSSSSSSSS